MLVEDKNDEVLNGIYIPENYEALKRMFINECYEQDKNNTETIARFTTAVADAIRSNLLSVKTIKEVFCAFEKEMNEATDEVFRKYYNLRSDINIDTNN